MSPAGVGARARPVRALELVLVFGGGAAALWLERRAVRFAFFPILWSAGLVAALVLRATGGLGRAALWPGGAFPAASLRRVLLRFAVGAPCLVAAVLAFRPERFLDFPRARPLLWAAILVGYPLLSVVPQELVFRALFFRRYATLFARRTALLVASAVAFSVAHAFLVNWPAVLLSLAGGWLFATTFERSRSLWLASLEHALWGDLVLTIGLAHSFYAGAPR